MLFNFQNLCPTLLICLSVGSGKFRTVNGLIGTNLLDGCLFY